MMVLNTSAESYKSSSSSVRAARNKTPSKSSIVRCRTPNEDDATNTSASGENNPINLSDLSKERSEMKKLNDGSDKEEGGEQGKKTPTSVEKRKVSNQSVEGQNKKILVYEKPSETYSKLYRDGCGRNPKPKAELMNTRPSEIPKLKQLATLNWKRRTKAAAAAATTTVPPITRKPSTGTTTISKAVDNDKKTAVTPETTSMKEGEGTLSEGKSVKTKRELKSEDKIKSALNENFSSLVPLYENELKKITDTWVNTTYCSLTTRTNLVKLLHEIMPSINKSQFQMEDETILQSITRTKSYTRSEAENLLQFVKLLIGNRNKVRDDYAQMMLNKEIAESHNNNWRSLTKRIGDLGDETRQLQQDIADLTKKKENYETLASDKIIKMQSNLTQKEEEIKKLANQLALLKQRENSYKGNVSLKIEDYKDIKEEVLMLKSIEKEFEELKAKYHNQNDNYEKKIKDLEIMLEERKKALKKENDIKTQLQSFLIQLHSHQRQLYKTIGKEQVDFVMGRSIQSRTKRREQLWLSAIKLVLKGFQVQTRKLERDKNKMLLELNSNDLENYNNLATAIMQKDNFIKSIRHQMHAFHMATKYSTAKASDSSIFDTIKTTTATHL